MSKGGAIVAVKKGFPFWAKRGRGDLRGLARGFVIASGAKQSRSPGPMSCFPSCRKKGQWGVIEVVVLGD